MARPEKSKSAPKAKTTTQTSVVDEFTAQHQGTTQALDQALDDMQVVADNIDISNQSVSDVAVVKLSVPTADNVADGAGKTNDTDLKENSEETSHNTPTAQQIAKETAQHKLDELAKQLGVKPPSDDSQSDEHVDTVDSKADEQTDDTQAFDVQHDNDSKDDKVGKKDDEQHDKSDDKANHSSNTSDPKTATDCTTHDDTSTSPSHATRTSLGGVGGLLAKAGSYLRDKSTETASHQGVDLNANSFAKHAFYVQGASLGGGIAKSIFGQKTATVQNLASKFISDDKLNAVSESIYHKIAELAHTWAVKSVPTDPKTLTPAQKDELAQSLADQNRALATAGGVTGFFGLKGVVMDTAWLLLVALRTVYQLSVVYDVPLTGKDGIKMAYGVLSGANLDKLQEKQVILTALALAGGVLAHADEGSLKEELVKLSSSNTTIKDFDELLKFAHLDKLADKYGIDIDNINTSWLRHLASISAVGVGAYYNRELIDEVIGTAMTTFKTNAMLAVEYQGD